MTQVQVKHFKNANEFRRWLQTHHATRTELWVGFYRKGCGKTGMSYPEAVDQALCFGWIDGVRKKVDEISYTNRFTPRTAKSAWSSINIRRVGDLTRLGLMAEPGLAAFRSRDEKRTRRYSSENRPTSLTPDLEKEFRTNKTAWAFWTAQPPGYRRVSIWFVMSAVRDETRRLRLGKLIEISAKRNRLEVMSPAKKR